MRGSRYTSTTRTYSVHPGCAINLIPCDNGTAAPQVLSLFQTNNPTAFSSMRVNLEAALPPGVKCLICDHRHNAWSYVITQKHQPPRGCHLTCVRGQLINPARTQLVNLRDYYTCAPYSRQENIIKSVIMFLVSITENAVQFPLNIIVVGAIKFLAANATYAVIIYSILLIFSFFPCINSWHIYIYIA